MTKKVERLVDTAVNNFGNQVMRILKSPKITWRVLRYLSVGFSIYFLITSLMYSFEEIRVFTKYLNENPTFFEDFFKNVEKSLASVPIVEANETIMSFASLPLALITIVLVFIGTMTILNTVENLQKKFRNR